LLEFLAVALFLDHFGEFGDACVLVGVDHSVLRA
jgi:hypothetical protein